MLSWDNLKIACTKSSLCFLISHRFVGVQGHGVDVLFVGAHPATQRCVAPVRPRLVGWAAPFRAVPPSSHAAALGNGLGLRLRLCFARHVGTCRRAFRRQFQLLGAGIVICAFLCCCVHVSFSQHDVFLWSMVVICWTGITVLCEPFVPYSLLEFWFSKFGGSCPSGSRIIQHSAPQSATVMLSTSSPIPPIFLLARGIARCTTKCAAVMLWKLSSPFLPLSRHPFTIRDAAQKLGCFIDPNACFFTGFREVLSRRDVHESQCWNSPTSKACLLVTNFVLNGVPLLGSLGVQLLRYLDRAFHAAHVKTEPRMESVDDLRSKRCVH